MAQKPMINHEKAYWRIPRMFYEDHCERDLPAPPICGQNSRHVWIDLHDPRLHDLYEDAEFYAESTQGWDKGAHRYVYAARRLLAVLDEGLKSYGITK